MSLLPVSFFSFAVRRAQQGAALLDDCDPYWWNKINTELLNMGMPQYCILGQLYGSPDAGRRELGIQESAEVRFGFRAPNSSLIFGLEEYCARLTKAWLGQIAYRATENQGVPIPD